MPQKKKPTPKKTLPSKAQLKLKEKSDLEQPQVRVDAHREAHTTSDNITSARGRPKQTGDMKKITLTVSHDQIIWLDRLATDIRAASRVIIDRGTIIRALIDALKSSNLNLTHCTSEREILEALIRKLGLKE